MKSPQYAGFLLPAFPIGQPELKRFVRAVREGGGGDTTLRKHLKHLSTFLNAAVPDYLEHSPLTARFVQDLRLAKRRAALRPTRMSNSRS
jgi:hypothetical protein